MPFDVEAARKAGYPDNEIAQQLANESNFDYVKARNAGYGDREIIDELAYGPAQQPVDTPERQALVAELRQRESAAAQAGKDLQSTESLVANVARPLLQGLTVPADAVSALPRLGANLAIGGVNAALGTEIPQVQPLTSGQLAPQTQAERYAQSAVGSVAGALVPIGIGQQLLNAAAGSAANNIGQILTANVALQGASATTAGLSSQLAAEEGAGPLGQAAAGIAGALAPSVALVGAQAATRGALRGGEAGRQRVEQNIKTFERAGTTPSVGQATESRSARAAEQLLSGSPGGSGAIYRKGAQLAEDIGQQIDDNATRLAGKTSAEQAGRRIAEGVEGPSGFVARTKATQENLYRAVDAQIPPATPSSVANTQTALADLTRVTPGASRTTQNLVNPRIQQIADDLAADAAGGTVPYSAIKALRTRVGEMLDDGLVADVPQKQLRRLYGALSEDLRGAARAAGPTAERAFNRANNYTRARAQRLEVLDTVVQKNGGPEAIYKAATSGTAEGATRLRAVMQSLDDQGRKAVTATVLRRLGRAIPSQQDEVASKFSTETFLTNFSRLSKEAKSTLFDRYGPRFSKDLEAIAKVAANLREGSKVYANPSGTAPRAAAYTALGSFLTALGTGNVGVAAGIAGGVGGANLTARLMTNPNFVRFLAKSTSVPSGAYPSLLAQLGKLAESTGDAELEEARQFLGESVPKQFELPPPKSPPRGKAQGRVSMEIQ